MSVKQAQREVDAAEFSEWKAWFELQPFGDERGDLQAGVIAATIANVNRGKHTKAFEPTDFLLEFKHKQHTTKAQSPEYIKAVLFSLANIVNGNNSKP